MAYATTQDLLLRYDERRVADLVSDTGTRSTNPAASPVAEMALEDASGMIDAACRVSGRYKSIDLLGMTGHGANLLARLCCDLAYGLLVGRRGYSSTDQKAMAPQFEFANALLDSIRKGERVFDVYDGQDADAGTATMNTVLSLKTRTAGYDTLNDLVGNSHRLWGLRNPD
jgi:phage gp36-like protein